VRHCLIIEDDADNAAFIERSLSERGWRVVVCPDASAAATQALGQPWDVIVLDRMLPNDVDGLSLVEALRAQGRRTPVLVLSALAATDERVRGLNAGCDDYLTKPFSFEELIARLEALVRRSEPEPVSRELHAGDLTVDLITRTVTRAEREILLQPREFRLLAYLMSHQGRVVTRSMLLEAVWDYRFDPETNVIDVHISRLRGKIDRDTDRPVIHTVRGVGYTLSADAPAEPGTAG